LSFSWSFAGSLFSFQRMPTARQAHRARTPMMMPKMAPPSKPPVAETVPSRGATTGWVVTAATVMLTPLTAESIVVAPLGVLVTAAIVDCTVVAADDGTRIATSRMTLPDVIVIVTAD